MNNYLAEMLAVFLLCSIIAMLCVIALVTNWQEKNMRTLIFIVLGFLTTELIVFETLWFLMFLGVQI